MWIEIKQRQDGLYDIFNKNTGVEYLKVCSKDLDDFFAVQVEKDRNGVNIVCIISHY